MGNTLCERTFAEEALPTSLWDNFCETICAKQLLRREIWESTTDVTFRQQQRDAGATTVLLIPALGISVAVQARGLRCWCSLFASTLKCCRRTKSNLLRSSFRGSARKSDYKVKCALYHVHPTEAGATTALSRGHFVTYVKQGESWHLADDSNVLSDSLQKSRLAIRV